MMRAIFALFLHALIIRGTKIFGESQCEKEKFEADEKYRNNPCLVGLNIPLCAEDGQYQRKQCSGSSGYCWCVEPNTGKQIPNTAAQPWIKEVNCEYNEVEKTKCEKEKLEAEEFYRNNPGFVGLDKRHCTEDGLYQQKQCSESSGYCWCVEPGTGNKIPNTDHRPWIRQVNCEVTEQKKDCADKTKCEKAKFEAEEKYRNNPGFVGLEKPQCTKEGLYQQKQCSGSSGFCWCVEPGTGNKIPNTDHRPWIRQVNC